MPSPVLDESLAIGLLEYLPRCPFNGTAPQIAAGHTNEQIACRINLSHMTAEISLARIFKKLVGTCRA